jgi:acetolactate synthase-1/2/3 large subunit
MPALTGAQAIIRALRSHGIDTVFGLPGGQLDHLFDAMFQEGPALRVFHTRHEQGAAYMAYGYSASTGRVGVYTVVPGPGLLNTTAALSTAWANNAKVLALSGQLHAAGIDSGYGHLHEIPDQLGLIRHLTKWAQRIELPGDAPAAVAQAMQALHTGRPRPVELEMAMDVMGQTAEVTPLPARDRYPRPPVDLDAIGAAAALLGRAERPLIFIGSGALDAGEPLRAVAEALQAPVVAFRKGRGVIDERHHLSQTWPGGHRFWAQADVVLAVGTRLMLPLTAWGKDSDLKIVRIDIDPDEIGRICAPEVGILADAYDALSALVPALERRNRARRDRAEELAAFKTGLEAEFRAHVPEQMAWLDAIRDVLPEDGIFVDEVTQVGFTSWYGFKVYRPRQFVTAGYQGTLGYGYATALGVVAGNPGKRVVQVSGDGGFMFNVQELATAVHHRLPLVTIVFNDNTFTNVQRQQDEWFEGRRICSDLSNPDFVRLAEVFGATGLRAHTPQELRKALAQGFSAGGPVIIEVPITRRMATPWRFILLGQNRKQLCP